MPEMILYKDHPAMFRNRPVLFLVCCALIPFGIGIVVLLAWWLRCLATSLVITESRVTLRKGLLSKSTNDVLITDIRNVQVRQSFLQRIFGVGSVAVSTSGQSDMEIDVPGMPAPERIKEILNDRRTGVRRMYPGRKTPPQVFRRRAPPRSGQSHRQVVQILGDDAVAG
jgi:membrane protein YdbS with pleckstrin-like domain